MWGGTSHGTWTDAPRSKCASFQFTVWNKCQGHLCQVCQVALTLASNHELKKKRSHWFAPLGSSSRYRAVTGEQTLNGSLKRPFGSYSPLSPPWCHRFCCLTPLWDRVGCVFLASGHEWLTELDATGTSCLHCYHKTQNKDTVQCRQASSICPFSFFNGLYSDLSHMKLLLAACHWFLGLTWAGAAHVFFFCFFFKDVALAAEYLSFMALIFS